MVDFGIPNFSARAAKGLDRRRPLRTAVIGAGYWGRRVVREILDMSKRTGEVILESVVDISPTALAGCMRDFPGPDYRLDYRPLLKNCGLSAVHICTPNLTHFSVASDFLQASKHVLVEKPLALTTKDAYELVQLAREDDRVLSAGHLMRFNNGIRALKNSLTSGVIGEPFYARITWTGPLPPQKDREIITDLAPHPIDLANNITGEWPEKITCTGKRYRTGAAGEEVAFINGEHHSGLTVNIEVSWLDPDKHRDVTVVGSRGIANLNCLDQRVTVRTEDSIQEIPTVPSNTLGEEITHFLDCVRQSERAQPVENQADGVLGAETVRVLSACRESLKLGQTVRLVSPNKER